MSDVTGGPSAEGPLRVRHRSTFLVRWDAVLTVIAAFVAGIALGVSIAFQIIT